MKSLLTSRSGLKYGVFFVNIDCLVAYAWFRAIETILQFKSSQRTGVRIFEQIRNDLRTKFDCSKVILSLYR